MKQTKKIKKISSTKKACICFFIVLLGFGRLHGSGNNKYFLYQNGKKTTIQQGSPQIQQLHKAIESFTAMQEVDSYPPIISNIIPAPGAVDVPINTDISFNISDGLSDIDLSKLHVGVSRVSAILDGVNDAPKLYATLIESDGNGGYNVTIDRHRCFSFAREIEVQIDAYDNNGNLTLLEYSFTTVKGLENMSIEPGGVYTDEPTTVTIMSYVAEDLNPISASAHLKRYDQNKQLVGSPITMYDDGTNGDSLANDKIYTTQVVLNEPVKTKIYYRFFVDCEDYPAIESDYHDVAVVKVITMEEWTAREKLQESISPLVEKWLIDSDFNLYFTSKMLVEYLEKHTDIVKEASFDNYGDSDIGFRYNNGERVTINLFRDFIKKDEKLLDGYMSRDISSQERERKKEKAAKEKAAEDKRLAELNKRRNERAAKIKQDKTLEVAFSEPQKFQIVNKGQYKTLEVNSMLISLDKGVVYWGQDFYTTAYEGGDDEKELIELNKAVSAITNTK